MRKRILAVVLAALIMCATVCGCGSKSSGNDTVSDNANQNIISQVQREEDTSHDNTNDTEIQLNLSYNFSEDLAWVKFRKGADSNTYYGCIDKSGNLLFFFEQEGLVNVKSYSSGYTYIETSDNLYLIDKTGTVLQTYPIVPEKRGNKAIAYADGYVWCQECVSEFDESYFKYTLYDPNGKSVTDFEYEGTKPIESINNYGQKVWGYNNGYNKWRIYFTESNKWIDSGSEFYFYDNKSLICTSHDSENTDIGFLAFIDTKGNESYVKIPESVGRWNNIKCFALNDNCCMLYKYSPNDCIIRYDASSDKFVNMGGEYADKLNYEFLMDNSGDLKFENGRIALPLIGSDKEYYTGLFDTSLNIVGKPVNGFGSFSDGKLVINNSVYDSNLNLLFIAEDFGYKEVSPYHNGVAHAKTDGAQISSGGEEFGYDYNWFYIDSNGERLFNSINTESAVQIEIN